MQNFFCSNRKRKVHKDGNEDIITISYKIHFNARIIENSLSNLVKNLAEEIHEIICKDCNCFMFFFNTKVSMTI